MLVPFSDMRHHTKELDLESSQVLATLQRTGEVHGIMKADLPGVQVFALGVDGAGKSVVYWQTLERILEGIFLEFRSSVRHLLRSSDTRNIESSTR